MRKGKKTRFIEDSSIYKTQYMHRHGRDRVMNGWRRMWVDIVKWKERKINGKSTVHVDNKLYIHFKLDCRRCEKKRMKKITQTRSCNLLVQCWSVYFATLLLRNGLPCSCDFYHCSRIHQSIAKWMAYTTTDAVSWPKLILQIGWLCCAYHCFYVQEIYQELKRNKMNRLTAVKTSWESLFSLHRVVFFVCYLLLTFTLNHVQIKQHGEWNDAQMKWKQTRLKRIYRTDMLQISPGQIGICF